MKHVRFFFLLALALFVFAFSGMVQAPSDGPSSLSPASLQATRYLDEALDYIQTHSVKTKQMNWPVLRQEAFAMAGNAQTTADTYPAIRMVVQRLGNHHSFFLDPASAKLVNQGRSAGFGLTMASPNVIVEVIPNSPADRAGVRERDTILAINGTPLAKMSQNDINTALYARSQIRLTVRHADQVQPVTLAINAAVYDNYRPPFAQRLGKGIGYIDVPSASYQTRVQYATTGQHAIEQVDHPATCGWIVDLRRNQGGSIDPMIVAVGPILGEGDIGAFVDANGNRAVWNYHDGGFYEANQARFKIDHPYHLQHPMPPVAILTSGFTASAGEATLVSFRGRPHTRSFGVPTYGVPTGNASKQLSDGAELVLTVVLEADRTGRTYDAPMPPDQTVQINWSQLNTPNDPVILAAGQWLQSQGCH